MNSMKSTRLLLPRKNKKQPVSVIWMNVEFRRFSAGQLLLGGACHAPVSRRQERDDCSDSTESGRSLFCDFAVITFLL